MPKSVQLFVSYSHKDRGLRDHIDDMLQVLRQELDQVLDIVFDDHMAGGEEWEKKILGWVDDCDIALLLLSDDFLQSKFVKEKELKRLEERSKDEHSKKEQNPRIYPILLRECTQPLPSLITIKQIRPDEKTPLGSMTREQRDAALAVMKRELGCFAQDLMPHPPPPPDLPNKIIDVEVTLGHRDRDLYLGEMRSSYPDEESPQPVVAFEIRFERSKKGSLDRDAYGAYLGEQLFPDHPGLEEDLGLRPIDDTEENSPVRTPASILEQALRDAAATDTVLRLRVAISSNARELNYHPWEQMRSPKTRSILALNPNIYFSRTIVGYNENWREIHLRRIPADTKDIKTLIFVPGRANVLNEDGDTIGEVDPDRQLEYAQKCLKDSEQVPVSKVGGFEDLFSTLSANPFDILLLVVAKTETEDRWPLLEFTSQDRQTKRYRYHEVARAFRDLPTPPRLVILATPCVDSSGVPAQDCAIFGIQDFAPAIAEAGVPAVITTQAATRPENWIAFLTELFRLLPQCEGIDRAVSLARQRMEAGSPKREDWWKPVLISRLRSSRIWYEPGFEDLSSAERNRILAALRGSLAKQTLLPIVGPGIIHDIAGSRREIARRWAYDYGFPMEHHNRMNLPQVAQYLQIQAGRDALESRLKSTMTSLIRERHSDDISHLDANTELDELFRAINTKQRAANPDYEPHGLLAKLDVPIYLTTNLSSILEKALEEEGKTPIAFTFHELAKRERDGKDEIETDDATVERPWVIHLFGALNDLENAALTEDDFFDFLSDFSATMNQEVIVQIKQVLANSSLVLLGFRIHHSTFRTLFLSIRRLEGINRQRHYRHVAVQFDPDDDQMTNPRGAKEYLRLLFDEDDLNVYWGGAEDFLRELKPAKKSEP